MKSVFERHIDQRQLVPPAYDADLARVEQLADQRFPTATVEQARAARCDRGYPGRRSRYSRGNKGDGDEVSGCDRAFFAGRRARECLARARRSVEARCEAAVELDRMDLVGRFGVTSGMEEVDQPNAVCLLARTLSEVAQCS